MRLRWIVYAYLMIGGGLFLAMLQVPLVANTTKPFAGALGLGSYGIVGAGSLVGGLLCGRLSRARTLLEPATAALLVVCSIALPTFIMRGTFEPLVFSGAQLALLATVGFVCALAGAAVGNHLHGKPSQFVDAVSFVSLLAGLYYAILVLAMFIALVSEMFSTIVAVPLVFVAPVIAGMFAAVLFPDRAMRTAAFGTTLIGALLASYAVINAIPKGPTEALIKGIAASFFVGVVIVLSCAGAFAADKFNLTRFAEPLAPEPPIASARVTKS